MFDLSVLSKMINEYALITSQIAKVDVEVVNYNLIRVAGTGTFKNQVERDMSSEGFVYKHVLKTGQRRIVSNPGRDMLCRNCSSNDQCKETFEIATPIVVHHDVIGVIGMVCTTYEQKKIVEENLNSYLEYLDQIAQFIQAKVIETQEDTNKRAMLSMLESITKSMDEGAIIIDNNGNIDKINPSAKMQLGIKRIIYKEKIDIRATGDMLNNATEYMVTIKNKKYKVYGDIIEIPNNDLFSKVLLFRDYKSVRSSIYKMTATIQMGDSDAILGNSENINKLKEDILKISSSNSTVLITGESGTGKEMVATSIWKNSDRKNQRFVAINCAAIPEALLESELFGYVKGAFTGADPNGKIGKFELADKGILFLDEIGDMPLYLQVKLLRVLQERSISRIGSNQVIPLNIRIIAATNKDLKTMIQEKKFREDLYYRLNVIPLKIAPLRDRVEDIELLARHFINRYATVFEKEVHFIEPSTLEKLKSYPWHGNVRELENVIEFMINMMEEGQINDLTLPHNISNHDGQPTKSGELRTLKEVEMEAIEQAMRKYPQSTKGKNEMANALGIGIATLYRKIEQYGFSE